MSEFLPDLKPEPGWEEVWPFPFMEAHRTFAGPAGMPGVALRYFKKPDGELAAKVWFGPSSEGARGRSHGGALLTVLDEAMGAAAWTRGLPVLTTRLNTTFRRGVPLNTELLIETRLLSTKGRAIRIEGSLLGKDGTRYTEATGVFVRIPKDSIRETFDAG